MRRVKVFSLITMVGILLWPLVGLEADVVSTNPPNVYSGVNATAIEQLNNSYQTGAISYSDYQSQMTQLVHSGSTIPNNTALSPIMASYGAAVLNGSDASLTEMPDLSALQKKVVTHNSADVDFSCSASVCPDGFSLLAGDCSDPSTIIYCVKTDGDFATGRTDTVLSYNSDGTPHLYSFYTNGTLPYGSMIQWVYPPCNVPPLPAICQSTVYDNDFVSQANFDPLLTALETNQPGIKFFYANVTSQGYYQIQYTLP